MDFLVIIKDALGRISLSSIHSPRVMLQLRGNHGGDKVIDKR
jgi:hypothetical protein